MSKQFLYTLILAFSFYLSQAQTLTVSTSQLNFGVTYENAPDSLQLTIYNNVGKTVSVTGFRFYNIYGQPAFSCANSSFSIADGSSQTVWIKFAPLHNIYHNSELIIENDAYRGFVSVDLVGQGRYSKTYYNASENLEEQVLKTTLQTIISNGYVSLSYNNARDAMFMTIDNQKINGQGATQNTIECVYTGRLAVGYTSRSDCQSNYSFNTEHTFPQSLFGSTPMESDLHHLFPTDNTANGVRSNYPFGIATNVSWMQGGSKFDNLSNIFEPRDVQKGATARAMLYFVVRYQNYSNFLNSQESILKTWNHNYLPTTVEQVRNNAIFSLQNNRNPFVDYPQLANRITSFSTTSIAPTNFLMDKTQSEIDYGYVLNATNTVYNYVIVNNGNQTIQFSNFTLNNNSLFSFVGSSGASASLNPGEALNVAIDFHPTVTGVVNDTLYFQTNVPGSNNVQIPIVAHSSLVGVQEINAKDELIIYPNPVKNEFTVYGLQFTVGDELKIIDVFGKNVFKTKIVSPNDDCKLSTANFSSGIYFLSVSHSNLMITSQRFVKY